MAIKSNAVTNKLASSIARFSFKMYSQIAGRETGKNVFVSPFSILSAMAMVYNGANGETQTALAKGLELNGMSLDDINGAMSGLVGVLNDPQAKEQVSIANSLWARRGLDFKPEFIEANRQYYDVEVKDVEFNPATVQAINDWVRQKTNGKISHIIEKLDPMIVLMLINAIYFKGAWKDPFNEKATQPEPFYLVNGQQKQHPMMRQKGRYDTLEGDTFQAIKIPYTGNIAMYIFLPNRNSSLGEFQSKLNEANWTRWLSQFSNHEGQILMPRFKFEYSADIVGDLNSLGMGIAFDRAKADFSKIGTFQPNIALDEVKHKTYVDVNEEGTEAAAVTSISVLFGGMLMPTPSFNMRVDRPFFFAIYDAATGTMLFMGNVVEP